VIADILSNSRFEWGDAYLIAGILKTIYGRNLGSLAGGLLYLLSVGSVDGVALEDGCLVVIKALQPDG
jgi:hypothetical protein